MQRTPALCRRSLHAGKWPPLGACLHFRSLRCSPHLRQCQRASAGQRDGLLRVHVSVLVALLFDGLVRQDMQAGQAVQLSQIGVSRGGCMVGGAREEASSSACRQAAAGAAARERWKSPCAFATALCMRKQASCSNACRRLQTRQCKPHLSQRWRSAPPAECAAVWGRRGTARAGRPKSGAAARLQQRSSDRERQRCACAMRHVIPGGCYNLQSAGSTG